MKVKGRRYGGINKKRYSGKVEERWRERKTGGQAGDEAYRLQGECAGLSFPPKHWYVICRPLEVFVVAFVFGSFLENSLSALFPFFEIFNFLVVPVVYCCFRFQCQIQKTTAKSNVKEFTVYIFLQAFYDSIQLTFNSLIHFELLFVQSLRQRSNSLFACVLPIFPTVFIEEVVLSPLYTYILGLVYYICMSVLFLKTAYGSMIFSKQFFKSMGLSENPLQVQYQYDFSLSWKNTGINYGGNSNSPVILT